MADEIRQFTSLVPAGTPANAPATFSMAIPPRDVVRMDITVPPGVSGLVGFAIFVGGVQVIPYQSDTWIVTADEKMVWDLANYPDAGSWSLVAYNTGTNDHAVTVRMHCNVKGRGQRTPATFIDAAALEPTPYTTTPDGTAP